MKFIFLYLLYEFLGTLENCTQRGLQGIGMKHFLRLVHTGSIRNHLRSIHPVSAIESMEVEAWDLCWELGKAKSCTQLTTVNTS